MKERQQILLDEIKQISQQYQQQVPGRRKAWPNAIKQRVIALKDLGLSFKAISEQTGLPYFTVLGWRETRGTFRQVSPSQEIVTATVTVPTCPLIPATVIPTATVTVATPEGYRIEGLSISQLIELLRGMG
jgi:hypothetical protein